MREKQQQEGRTMTTNYDELKTLDITVEKNEDGTPKNLGDNSYVAGWEENEVWITMDDDGTYSVSSGWLAGYTAEIDEERDGSLHGLTLEAAIERANSTAEDHRQDMLDAEDRRIDCEE
jgi:hypothetical protein